MILFNQTSASQQKFKSDRSSDRPIRSIVKSISWRMLGTIDTIFIAWLITGTFEVALSIGSVEWISKMILYFLHERAWNSIKWGRI